MNVEVDNIFEPNQNQCHLEDIESKDYQKKIEIEKKLSIKIASFIRIPSHDGNAEWLIWDYIGRGIGDKGYYKIRFRFIELYNLNLIIF